jgi:hypothetical protein
MTTQLTAREVAEAALTYIASLSERGGIIPKEELDGAKRNRSAEGVIHIKNVEKLPEVASDSAALDKAEEFVSEYMRKNGVSYCVPCNLTPLFVAYAEQCGFPKEATQQ